MVTAGNGEMVDVFLDRVVAAVAANTLHAWTPTHDATADTLTFRNTVGGPQTAQWQLDHSREATGDDAGDIQFTGAAGQEPEPDPAPNDQLLALVDTPGGLPTHSVTIVEPDGRGTMQVIPLMGIPDQMGDARNNTITDTIVAALNTGTAFSPRWTFAATDNVITITSRASDWAIHSDSTTFRDVEFAMRRWQNGQMSTDNSVTLASTAVRQGHPAVAATSIDISFVNSRGETETVPRFTVVDGATATQVAEAVRENLQDVPSINVNAVASDPTQVVYTTRDFGQGTLTLTVEYDEQTRQDTPNSYRRRGDGTTFTAPLLEGAEARSPVDRAQLTPASIVRPGTNDPDRPWATSVFNLGREFVLVAVNNQIQGYGFGYTFGAAPAGTVTGAPFTGDTYNSYVERIHNSMDGEFEYTKAAESVQLLLSDGNVDVTLGMTDSPGDTRNTFMDENGVAVEKRPFDYQEDYKVDFRRHGRLFNIRIEDEDITTEGVTFDGTDSPWRLSGYGMSISKEEKRGGRRS